MFMFELFDPMLVIRFSVLDLSSKMGEMQLETWIEY